LPLIEGKEKLEFEPQDPIGWLSPGTLVPAALGVALSTTFGRFADKRELFASVPPVMPGHEPGRDGD
jgi:hypothetical protein